MTVNVEIPESVYLPAGVEAGPFATVFTYEDPAEVVVVIATGDEEDAPLELGTDYTLAATNPMVSGGQVTLFGGAIPAGGWGEGVYSLIIRRQTPQNQTQELGAQQGLRLDLLEKALDRIVRIGQEIALRVSQGGGGGGGGGGAGALLAANNLADLTNKPAARVNLGLGNAATRNVGTAAGTVAAGDDPRFAAQLGAPGLADINDYVAVGDTTYDAAYALCMAANNKVYFPAKPRKITDPNNYYRFNSTLSVGSGQAIIGDGPGVSKIVQNNANVDVVTLGQSILWYAIYGVTLAHLTIGTGAGVKQGQGLTDWVDNCYVEAVFVTGCSYGFDLGKHFSGRYLNCHVSGVSQRGFRNVTTGNSTVSGIAQGGPMQAVFEHCSASACGNAGFSYGATGVSSGGSGAGSSLGTLVGFTTFANGHHGITIDTVAAHPLHAVRIIGGFMGEDALSGVYLNSYAGNHLVAPDYIELEGQYGVCVTANNSDVLVAPKVVAGCWNDGAVSLGATDTRFDGGLYVNNGRAAGVGVTWVGIRVDGGSAMINAVRCKDTGAGTQTFGLSITGDDVLVNGCDLRGNVTNPIVWGSGPTNSVVSGSRPVTVNTGGGIGNTVTGNLTVTGDILANGKITATTDLISNGLAHFNGTNVAILGDLSMPSGSIYCIGTGVNQGGVIATNITSNRSMSIGTSASGVVGRLDVGSITLSGSLSMSGSITGVTSLTASGNITSTGGNISASAGSLTAGGGITAGGNVTASGNINATSGTVSAAGLSITSSASLPATTMGGALNMNTYGITNMGNSGGLGTLTMIAGLGTTGPITCANLTATASVGVGVSAPGNVGRLLVNSAIYTAGTLMNVP